LSLLSELQAIPAAPSRCPIVQIRATLGDEADELDQAMNDPAIRNVDLGVVLRRRGFNVADNAIGRHRRGRCSCGTS